MSSRVWESAHIKAKPGKVWDALRPFKFQWNKLVASAELNEEKSNPDSREGTVGSVTAVTYKDGTVQQLRLIGLSDAKRSLTWEVLSSVPEVSYLSAIHTLTLRRVTSSDSTFVEWVVDFSKDAGQDVLQDARFKVQEAFSSLERAVTVRKVRVKNWMPLESDPDLMNEYIHKLGVSQDFQFYEVFGVDPGLLEMVPQPVFAVLMLFPISEASEKHAEDQVEQLKQQGQKLSGNVYHMRQTIGNACGTIGLVHSILNCAGEVALDEKKFFSKFLKETRGMTAMQRAKALEENKDIEEEHEVLARAGGSSVQSRANDNLHFIAFVEVEGHLYELDGIKPFPINHGPTSSATLLSDAARVAQDFMARDPNDVRFNIVALGRA